jgi:hypothetical protein
MASSSLGGAYSSARAQELQGDYQRFQGDKNAKFIERQIKDLDRASDDQANNARKKGHQVIGAQKASFASQGIDVNSGVARQVQMETKELSELDALSIKGNAYRQAYGLEIQASNERSQGRYAQMAGRFGARSTLLTGGLQAAGYGMRGARKAGWIGKSSSSENGGGYGTAGGSYSDFSNYS